MFTQEHYYFIADKINYFETVLMLEKHYNFKLYCFFIINHFQEKFKTDFSREEIENLIQEINLEHGHNL